MATLAPINRMCFARLDMKFFSLLLALSLKLIYLYLQPLGDVYCLWMYANRNSSFVWNDSGKSINYFNCLNTPFLTAYSATNALTGDGLDEAIQWLSGKLCIPLHEMHICCYFI